MRIPILTYHSYQGRDPGDILAFEEHLKILNAEGFLVLPLRIIVEKLVSGSDLPEKAVGVSCDDGKRYDFLAEPRIGKSMYSVLLSFIRRHRLRQRLAHMTCFVIADSWARLDIGLGDAELLTASWWRTAQKTGIIGIENHSLDHAHERVRRPECCGYTNSFFIETLEEADRQIAVAARVIDHLAGNERCKLFAYPFGHFSDYLVNEYFPRYADRHGMTAAFTTIPEPVTTETNRWKMPRYVVGCHIKDIPDLVSVLQECRRSQFSACSSLIGRS